MKTTLAIVCSIALFSGCNLVKKDEDENTNADVNGLTGSGQGSNDDPSTTAPSGTASLAAPSNFEDGESYDPATGGFTLRWGAVDDAVSYEIAVGSSAGATDVADWQDVGIATTASTSSLNLPNAGFFYASIRAVASDGSRGEITTGDGWSHLSCPPNWVRVEGNTTPGLGGSVYINGTATRHDGSSRMVSEFCVMKYEMKLNDTQGIYPGHLGTPGLVMNGNFNNSIDYSSTGNVDGYQAISVPEGQPWSNIKRKDIDTSTDLLDAERACSAIAGRSLVSPASLDNHFYVINNAQWQAIARDIESVAANWNDATAGSEDSDYINQGFFEDTNMNALSLAADSDDANGCFGIEAADPDISGLSATCNDSWDSRKRTHTLSNGEVIWDIGGNVMEWVIDDRDTVNDATANGYASADNFVSLDPFDDEEGAVGSNLLMWGSAVDHTGKNSGAHGGLGWINDDTGIGGAVARGGYWQWGNNSGIYSSWLDASASAFAELVGTRCVWAP